MCLKSQPIFFKKHEGNLMNDPFQLNIFLPSEKHEKHTSIKKQQSSTLTGRLSQTIKDLRDMFQSRWIHSSDTNGQTIRHA